MHPADAMNGATQNALLKSLEEPGPETVFLMVSSYAHRLLPTIRSRCQAVKLPRPARADGLAWLREQGVEAKLAEPLLAMAGGAPLAAMAMGDRAQFLAQLAVQLADRRADPLAIAAFCQGAAPAEVVNALYRWCYDLLVCAMGNTPRYYVAQSQTLNSLEIGRAHV